MGNHKSAAAKLPNASSLAIASKNIRFIDALRGLSALWVVLGHAREEPIGIGKYDTNSWLYFLTYIKESLAVPVFIMLSGLLLSYSYVGWDWQKWKGSLHFMKRRAARIYPAYLATILIICVCSLIFPALGSQGTPRWLLALPIDGGAILTHLAMIHNHFPAYALRIEPPLWSLAVEWQIYLCFAFITMPLGVRFGARGFLVGIGALMAIFSGLSRGIDHLAFAFCLGVGVAWLTFNVRVLLNLKKQALIVLAAIFITVLCVMGLVKSSLHTLIYEISFALLLIVLLQYKDREFAHLPSALKVLDGKSLRLLGWFSYSLYLVHYPILSVFGYYCLKNNINKSQSGFIMVLGILISTIFALLYSIVFEHRKRPTRAQFVS